MNQLVNVPLAMETLRENHIIDRCVRKDSMSGDLNCIMQDRFLCNGFIM